MEHKKGNRQLKLRKAADNMAGSTKEMWTEMADVFCPDNLNCWCHSDINDRTYQSASSTKLLKHISEPVGTESKTSADNWNSALTNPY